MFIIGVVIDWAFISRLRGSERTSMSLLVTYAVALIIEGVLYKIYGRTTSRSTPVHVNSTVHVFGFYIEYIYIYGFIMAIALVVALYALLYRTRFGRSVRATMQDETAARLVGIDVNRVAALTFGVGVAVTAAGGMVYGATNAFNANSGYDLISRLLAIVILGGMGSLGGALGAAVFMITLESVVTIWYPTWAVARLLRRARLVLVGPAERPLRPEGGAGPVSTPQVVCPKGTRGLVVLGRTARSLFPIVFRQPAGDHVRRVRADLRHGRGRVEHLLRQHRLHLAGHGGVLRQRRLRAGRRGVGLAFQRRRRHSPCCPLAGVVGAIIAVPFGLIALRVRRHTFIVITIAVFFIFQLMAYNLRSRTARSG